MKTVFRYSLALLLFQVSVSACVAQLSPELQDYEDKVQSEEFSDGFPFAEYSHAYFSQLENAELESCLFDDAHASVSIRAGWELLLREWAIPTRDAEPFTPAPLERVQRFIGFVEGRLVIDLPEWWEAAVKSGRRWDEGNTSFHIPGRVQHNVHVPKDWRHVELDGRDLYNGIWLHRRIKDADWEDGVLSLRMAETCKNKHSFRVWDERLQPSALDRVNALEVDSLVFAEVHGPYCREFPVVAFDSQKGALKWQAKVWSAPPVAYSGTYNGEHYTELVVHKRVLYVIGAGRDGVYIEGFRIEDGTPVIRFSSAY